MPHFLVVTRDGSGQEFQDRRAEFRDQHLSNLGPTIDAKELLGGGAYSDENGDMIGSVIIVDMPSKEAVEEWLAKDLYAKNDVWQKIEVFGVHFGNYHMEKLR